MIGRKNASTILVLGAVLFLLGCTTTGPGVISRGYSWNDGPYLIQDGPWESSVTVCWMTAEEKDSLLVWGDSPSALSHRETSRDSRMHSVKITGLTPETTYYYSVQEEFTLYKREKVFSFRTGPGEASEDSVMIVIAGDLQPKNDYTRLTNRILAEQIAAEDPDFIIQVGDAVQTGSSRDSWHDLMRSLPLMAAERPFLPAVGNHEYYVSHNNGSFRSVFPYDYPGKKSCYYSVDIGRIHIAYLDPYDGGPGWGKAKMTEKQKRWLVSDLEEAVNTGAQWLFVVLHQAVLSSGEFHDDVELRKWLLPLLSDYDVDAAFWGHTHLYEHWRYAYGENGYLLNRDDSPGRNPIDYFTIGTAGASLERNYDLFTHDPYREESHPWFNTETEMMEEIETVQYPWSREVFFEGRMGRDQFDREDLHYYHLPFDEEGDYSDDPSVSYATDNRWFGYLYGENALHYAKLTVEEDTSTLSIHYADGSLMAGPDGSRPQIFTFPKKDRSHLVR